MAKQFEIMVRGTVLHLPMEEQLKDMLRYDEGTLVKSTESPIEGRPWNRFEAIVHSKRYTKARWDSFMLKTDLIRRI